MINIVLSKVPHVMPPAGNQNNSAIQSPKDLLMAILVLVIIVVFMVVLVVLIQFCLGPMLADEERKSPPIGEKVNADAEIYSCCNHNMKNMT